MKKRIKNKEIIRLSDESVDFIAKYILRELDITTPINNDIIQDMYYLAEEYDEYLATKEVNPSFDFDEEKSIKAGKFSSELSGIILFDKAVDLDDLNTRLGLKS